MLSPRTMLNTTPPLKFSDFSGFSGSAPSATAIGEPTGKVPTSTSPTPVRLTVEVVEKNCCAMPGARKPVDTDPRSASPSIGSKRAATLPFTVSPKSEIGSASCRERVCQYVENSVVAGSVQQTNIKLQNKNKKTL